MRHVLFIHLPKTGGVSIETLIRAQEPPRAICPAGHSGFIRDLDFEKLDTYEFFFTHTSLNVREVLPRPMFVFTFLRDPVDRVISAYNHILRDDMIIGHQDIVANRLDLISALTHETVAPHFVDFATRALGSNVDLMSAYPDQEVMNLVEIFAAGAVADEFTYRRALMRLAELDFVGFTESLEADVRQVAAMLDLRVDRVPFENRGSDEGHALPKATRTPELEQAVRKHSPFDCLLYETAREVFCQGGRHSRPPDDATRRELARRASAPLPQALCGAAPARQSARAPDGDATRQGGTVDFLRSRSGSLLLRQQVEMLLAKLNGLRETTTAELVAVHTRAAAEIALRDRNIVEGAAYARTLEAARHDLTARVVELEQEVARLTAELHGARERAAAEIAGR